MIKAHDEFDFDEMRTLIDPTVFSNRDTFFTKEKFVEVCEEVKASCGEMISIEAFGTLNKIESVQTLWKVTYSKTEREMLWIMNVVNESGEYKIVYMSVH